MCIRDRRTIGSFFSDGMLKIPRYQRLYEWKKDEFGQFMEDLTGEDGFSPQYLGVIVSDKDEKSQSIEIIDGQQRLTTIFIILLAIRDALKANIANTKSTEEKKEWDAFNRKLENYITAFDETTGKEKMVLSSREPANELFKTIFDGGTIDEIKNQELKNIKTTFGYVQNVILGWGLDKMMEMFQAIRQSEFVHIEIGAASAYEIFEKMNNRGLELAVADLLKNRLFNFAEQDNVLDEMEERWTNLTENSLSISENIGKMNFGNLLKYFYTSRFGYVSKKKLYKELINRYEDYYKKDLDEFVSDIESVINILNILSNKRDDLSKADLRKLPGKNPERGYLRTILALKTFATIQPYSLLLSVFARERDYDIRHYLSKIEIFHFVYSFLLKGAAREFEKKYADVAPKIYNTSEKDEFERIMNTLMNDLESILVKSSSREVIKKNIKEKVYYGKNSDVVRLYYEYLEKDYKNRNSHGDTFINDAGVSIEHILPRNKQDIHTVGNLVILETDLNQKIKDKTFQEKKETILNEGTKISLTKDLFDKYHKWGETEIQEWEEESIELFMDKVIKKYFPKTCHE